MTDQQDTDNRKNDQAAERHQSRVARIDAALRHRGFTRKSLGEALGLSPSRMTEIFKGTRHLQVDELILIEDHLGLPSGSLIRTEATDVGPIDDEATDPAVSARVEMGSRLRGRREQLKISPERIARGIMTTSRYEAVELGLQQLELFEFDLIAQRLEVTIEWMITGRGPPPAP